MEIGIKKVNPLAQMPYKKYPSDSGYDLFSIERIYLRGGETKAIDTGLVFELPEGWEAQIRSRSGLSLKGVRVANSPGTIDQTYKGVVKVILITDFDFQVEIGTKIAQVVFSKIPETELKEISEVSVSDRGSNGFGSTGI